MESTAALQEEGPNRAVRSRSRGSVWPRLRYRADVRSLAFVGTFFGLVALQYTWTPTEWWIAAPLVALTCLFAFFGAVITHNTLHSPVFVERLHNRIFQCVLTCTYGHPVSAYVPGHNLSHHRHTQTRMDVMRTTKVAFRWNLLNLLAFFPVVVRAIMPTDARFARAMKARNPKWYAQLRTEWIAYGVFCAVLLAISWKKFLLYVVLPHQYAAWGIISINFLQHDGCDPDSEHNHSRNFVGRFVNWITFNNGYHGMHHEKPGLHWSLLPEAHRVHLHPHIHPSLEQKSLLAYIFRAFIWPARRVRYDGAPMDPPVDGPDVDWIEPLLQGPLPRDAMAEA